MFPNLFQPIKIKNIVIKNRIMSTGHDTMLPTAGVVNDELIAYHRARAIGGAGLIVLQVSGVHDTAQYTTNMLMATSEACVEPYRRLADAMHECGTTIFAQLFHPGREIVEAAEGHQPVAYAPSVSPSERFHIIPRALTLAMIGEIISGYGDAARRMQSAGIDGVELVASHGYLPAQFLNERINRRNDEYGRDFEGRLKFLKDVIHDIRSKTGPDYVVGLRISGNEMDHEGLQESDTLPIIQALSNQLSYVNIIAGTSSTASGAIHIVPPMAVKSAYLSSYAARIKRLVDIPIFVGGRINQPQEAEAIIAAGHADVCGMTRALITDPDMPNKAQQGKPDDIRACIGCNQACIGHFQKGVPISCIQNPQSGREMLLGRISPSKNLKRIVVAGGGPAGMKAAVTAAQRGHQVILYEKSKRLGGQVLLAQNLPGRSEFGGLVTNLIRETELYQVDIHTSTEISRGLIERDGPDAVIFAIGATPFIPDISTDGSMQIVTAWQVLSGEVTTGRSVLISDWKSDWIGIGIAEKLAREGCSVRLSVTGATAGETIQSYVRYQSVASLSKLGVQTIPYSRLFGCDGKSVYLQHTASGEPVVIDDVDTIILCHGHEPEYSAIADVLPGVQIFHIGDCVSARTAEEAVYEGFMAGYNI